MFRATIALALASHASAAPVLKTVLAAPALRSASVPALAAPAASPAAPSAAAPSAAAPLASESIKPSALNAILGGLEAAAAPVNPRPVRFDGEQPKPSLKDVAAGIGIGAATVPLALLTNLVRRPRLLSQTPLIVGLTPGFKPATKAVMLGAALPLAMPTLSTYYKPLRKARASARLGLTVYRREGFLAGLSAAIGQVAAYERRLDKQALVGDAAVKAMKPSAVHRLGVSFYLGALALGTAWLASSTPWLAWLWPAVFVEALAAPLVFIPGHRLPTKD